MSLRKKILKCPRKKQISGRKICKKRKSERDRENVKEEGRRENKIVLKRKLQVHHWTDRDKRRYFLLMGKVLHFIQNKILSFANFVVSIHQFYNSTIKNKFWNRKQNKLQILSIAWESSCIKSKTSTNRIYISM